MSKVIYTIKEDDNGNYLDWPRIKDLETRENNILEEKVLIE